jgi:hypothetical protein
MRVFRYMYSFVLLIGLILILAVCPPPIDEELLIFVEDEIAPSIVVFSPDNNSSYRSLLNVSGQVTDSSEKEGDKKGSVKTLSYAVLDHSQLSGDVPLSNDGIFAVSFATTGMSGTEILVIRAEDWNGNICERSLTLHENTTGPFIRIDSPENYSYYRSHVIVCGTVFNSEEDASTTEVGSVSWSIPGSALSGLIDPSDWEDGGFEFEFDTIGPPVLVGNRLVIVTAEDLNAHTSDASITLLEYPEGPYLQLTQPVDGQKYGSLITIEGKVWDSAGEPKSVKEIKSLTYKVGGNDPVGIAWKPEGDPNAGDFSTAFARGTFSGTMIIKVRVTDLNDHPAEQVVSLLDPEVGPQVTITSPDPASGYSRYLTVGGTVKDADGTTPPTDVGALSLVINPGPYSYNFAPAEYAGGFYSIANIQTDGWSGTQTITVTAVDNSNTRSTEVELDISTDGKKPVVTISSPGNLDYYPSNGTVSVNGNINHQLSRSEVNWGSLKYSVFPSSITNVPITSYNSSTGNYDFDFSTSGLAGAIVVTVKAEDYNRDSGEFSITLKEDTSVPEVSQLKPTTGTYGAGDTINIEVVFSEAVKVISGTPQFTLELDGGATRDVDYDGGIPSADTTLVFPYEVLEGDESSPLRYADSGTSLTGNIEDLNGNEADLDLPTWSNTIVVDGVKPKVNFVTAGNASGRYGIGETINVEVHFSEAVTVTGIPQLTLQVTSSNTRNINYSSTLSTATKLVFPYQIQENDEIDPLDYDGTGALSGTIEDDPAGNPWTGLLPASGSGNTLAERKSIDVDGVRPKIVSAEASNGGSAGTLDAGDYVTITFNENTNTPTIETGNINTVLKLSNSHSWLDNGDAIGSAIWTSEKGQQEHLHHESVRPHNGILLAGRSPRESLMLA